MNTALLLSYGFPNNLVLGRMLWKDWSTISNVTFNLFFQLLNFVKERANGSGLSSQTLSQAVETVKANIAWIQRNEKDLENWLQMFLSKKGELTKQSSDFSDAA